MIRFEKKTGITLGLAAVVAVAGLASTLKVEGDANIAPYKDYDPARSAMSMSH